MALSFANLFVKLLKEKVYDSPYLAVIEPPVANFLVALVLVVFKFLADNRFVGYLGVVELGSLVLY